MGGRVRTTVSTALENCEGDSRSQMNGVVLVRGLDLTHQLSRSSLVDWLQTRLLAGVVVHLLSYVMHVEPAAYAWRLAPPHTAGGGGGGGGRGCPEH